MIIHDQCVICRRWISLPIKKFVGRRRHSRNVGQSLIRIDVIASEQVAQLAAKVFSPSGSADLSELADDDTVTVENFKPLVSLDAAFALACYRYAVVVFDAFKVPNET